MGNQFIQSNWQWLTKSQRYCSISWLILSVWLSVWGWNAVDVAVLIPSSLFISLMTLDANWGPLSEGTFSGSPCSFHTLSLNNRATPSAVTDDVMGMTWVIFENQSTTTNMESYPWLLGNWVIRSVEITSHGRDGISFGINSPWGFSGNGLVRWQRSQPLTYFPMYAAIPGHQKLLWINSNVLHCPGCPATGMSWHDSTTS